MEMLGYIYKSSLRELFSAKRVISWLAIIVGLVLLAKATMVIGGQMPGPRRYVWLTEEIGFRVIALMCAVTTTYVVAGEIAQKTIVYLLTRPIPRPILLIGRAAASITFTAVVACMIVLAFGLLNYGFNPFANPYIGRDFISVACGCAAYGAIFVIISLWANKALMTSLFFAFGWEAMVPNMPGDIYLASVLSHMKGISSHPLELTADHDSSGAMNAMTSQAPISPMTGYLTLGIITIAILALACWWFKSFEFVPREDTE